MNFIEKDPGSFRTRLNQLGGGFEIVAGVHGIPRHSGLGVSGVLGGSVLLALRKFSGQGASGMEITKGELEKVAGLGVFLEQLIGTGGGYQDFLALAPGLKDIQARSANGRLRKIAPGGITPKFQLVELKPVVLDRIKAGMVLWDQGAHIPVEESLHAIVIDFLLGRNRGLREEWGSLYYDIKEALKEGDLERLGHLQSRSFELRRAICGTSWPEFADLYARRIEEELKKYFGSDYYGSDMSGSRPGAARIAFINPVRREEFEQVAPGIAMDIQKEILRKASGQRWTDVNFGKPRIYNFSIDVHGVSVSVGDRYTGVKKTMSNI